MKKKVGTGHFRGLVELNELKTKVSKTFPLPFNWVHYVLTDQPVQEFTLVFHNHSFAHLLTHSFNNYLWNIWGPGLSSKEVER